MCSFKDNPVPSLEKEVDNIILELDNAQYYGATPDLCVRASNLIYKLFKQNGVETNKEQPKCNICKNKGKVRKPYIKDTKQSTILCDKCFSQVFAGEN